MGATGLTRYRPPPRNPADPPRSNRASRGVVVVVLLFPFASLPTARTPGTMALGTLLLGRASGSSKKSKKKVRGCVARCAWAAAPPPLGVCRLSLTRVATSPADPPPHSPPRQLPSQRRCRLLARAVWRDGDFSTRSSPARWKARSPRFA